MAEPKETQDDGSAPGDVGADPSAPPRWVEILIAVFVAFQLIVPATYYLRDDPYDERFAWRMFSNIRLYQCRPTAFERREGAAEAPVQLTRHVHQAWINTVARNRVDVIVAMLDKRCEEPDMERVRLVNECHKTDGEELEPIEYALECRTGRLTVPEALPR